MRTRYNKALQEIHEELIKMGSMCEQSIELACKLLYREDETVLKHVNNLQKQINKEERIIEDLCMRVILLEQPVASDLRQISTALKMITDLERIGDQALDIATLPTFPSFSMEVCLDDMCAMCSFMLKNAITAFIQDDKRSAQEVIKSDDIVDRLFIQVKEEATKIIQENPNYSFDILNLLMVAKYLERVADHSVNIAECI